MYWYLFDIDYFYQERFEVPMNELCPTGLSSR